ncbi:hypothetical protein APSETT445_008542 [Aspergillus pseudonomiae]
MGLKLCVQKRSLQLRKNGIQPQIQLLVVVNFAAHEAQTVGPVVVKNLGSLDQRWIIDEKGTCLTTGCKGLLFLNAEAADVANRAEHLALVGGRACYGCVLTDEQPVSFGDLHDFVHVACEPAIVDWG